MKADVLTSLPLCNNGLFHIFRQFGHNWRFSRGGSDIFVQTELITIYNPHCLKCRKIEKASTFMKWIPPRVAIPSSYGIPTTVLRNKTQNFLCSFHGSVGFSKRNVFSASYQMILWLPRKLFLFYLGILLRFL